MQCPAAFFSRLLWNESPLRRDDDGALWPQPEASFALSVDMSRIGSVAWRSLRVVLPLIVLTVASIGYLPPLEWCVPFMIVAVGMMGFGNGAVFRSSLTGFTQQIGLASGLVGAAGGLGGFFVPIVLGTLKDMTGTYRTGFWLFGVVAAIAWLSTMLLRGIIAERP